MGRRCKRCNKIFDRTDMVVIGKAKSYDPSSIRFRGTGKAPVMCAPCAELTLAWLKEENAKRHHPANGIAITFIEERLATKEAQR